MSSADSVDAAATGVAGLDAILEGGLPRDRVYLAEGDPGAGKTTLGLQFLLTGVAAGERCLYVTLSESKEELLAVAASHGWSLDGIEIMELLLADGALSSESTYTVFQPAEVELGDTVTRVREEIERVNPRRVVIDSLAEFRLLAQSPLRYRRQVLALKQFFASRRCTVLLLDDRGSDDGDLQLRSIAHGVITLEQLAPEFGGARRRMRIVKLRAKEYIGGFHDFRIARGGLSVYPRLIAQDHATGLPRESLLSGNAELDALLGGGADYGTGTMLLGPAGTGKSTLAMQYVAAAANRGERAALFLFDERPRTLLTRMDGLGIPLRGHVESGRVTIQQIDPAELSPGEFAGVVQDAVDPESGPGASVVVIDSLNGYMQAMPEERFLVIQLHELLTFLCRRGVATFMVVAQQGLVGTNMQAPFDATYLADSVIVLRYFEVDGEIRQAISVVKRRTGNHERTLRRFSLSERGVEIGEPLSGLRGLLTGVPIRDVPNGGEVHSNL